jgi:hypothetical protein
MKGIYIVIIVIIILVLLILLIYIANKIYLSNSLSQRPTVTPIVCLQYGQYHDYEFSIYDKNDPSTIFFIYSLYRTLDNKNIVDDNYIINNFTIADHDMIRIHNFKNFTKIFGIYEFEFDHRKDIVGEINSNYNSSLEKPIDSPFIIDIKNRSIKNKKIVSIPVLMRINENNIMLYNEYNNSFIILYYRPKQILSETKLN